MTTKLEFERATYVVDATDVFINNKERVAIFYGLNKGVFEQMLNLIGASQYKVVHGEYKNNYNLSIILDKDINGINKISVDGESVWVFGE